MRKKLYSVLLVTINLLNSCSCYDEVWFNKDLPPVEDKIWYSQNGEDKPNFDFVFPNPSEGKDKESYGYLFYKDNKTKLNIWVYQYLSIIILPYDEIEKTTGDGTRINFIYNERKNKDIIHLKNDGLDLDKFGVNLADYLPFDLYIKDYDEEEWYSKYPEDRKE